MQMFSGPFQPRQQCCWVAHFVVVGPQRHWIATVPLGHSLLRRLLCMFPWAAPLETFGGVKVEWPILRPKWLNLGCQVTADDG